MKIRKITLAIVLALFLADKYIYGIETNYNAWIVIFLFWIAYNTANLEND